MKLRVLVPWGVELEEEVARVRGEALTGSFTLLPRHLDIVLVLVPGLVSTTRPDGSEVHLAVDGGTLVKVGEEVLLATPDAVRGPGLEELECAVRERFREVADHQRRARSALERMGSDIVQRLVELEEMTQRGR